MRTLSFRTVTREVQVQVEEETVGILLDGKTVGEFSIVDLYDLVFEAILETESTQPGLHRRREEVKLLKRIRLFGEFFT